MEAIRVKVYQFSELTQDAKNKVLDEFRCINVEHDWWESVYYDAKEIGLKITSFGLDRNRHTKGEFILSATEVAQNIQNNHGESCETYRTATQFLKDWQPIFNNYMDEESEMYESIEAEDELQEIEECFLNDLLEDYSIILQNECEYLQDDEAITETIEANEYLFTQYGKLVTIEEEEDEEEEMSEADKREERGIQQLEEARQSNW